MADRWENVYLEKYGIHYSRIIASWLNEGGKISMLRYEDPDRNVECAFIRWLKSIKDENGDRVLTDNEVYDIHNLATCGKLEWEGSAKRFLTVTKSK